MIRNCLMTLLALLLTSCAEVGVGDTSEPQGSGNPLPPLTGGGNGNDDTADDDDDDATSDDDDDSTPDDEGDDDTADDDDDDATSDDDDTADDDDTSDDDDDSTPADDDDDDATTAPPVTGDVSWWYQSEGSLIYDEMLAFAWSWAFQASSGDPDCEDCYVLLGIGEDTNDLSGGISQQPDLNDLPQGTVVSFDVLMQSSGGDEIWSCQNGAPSGVLRVWWGSQEQTVCTDDWGAGCSRVVEMGSGNCAAF